MGYEYEEKKKYAFKGGGIAPCPYAAHRICIDLIENGKTVLDIGCTTGHLSAELRKKGCKVIGLEIDPEMADITKANCDEVICGNAEDIEIPYRNYFDVILYADVLEHIRNPLEVLTRFRDSLKKDGYIVYH